MSDRCGAGPLARVCFACAGILAGNAALVLWFLPAVVVGGAGRPQAMVATFQIVTLYVAVSASVGMLVGVPVALAVPSRLLVDVRWPVCVIVGALLGPFALVLVFVAMFALQGRLHEFSLAHTETFWPLSIVVSTVAFIVYVALLRRRAVSSTSR